MVAAAVSVLASRCSKGHHAACAARGRGLSSLEPLLHARALAVDAVAAGGSVAAVTALAAAASVNVSLGAPSCSQTLFAQ